MLQTKRLCLRNLCAADFPALYAVRNDARCARYQRWQHTDEASLRPFLARFAGCVFPSQEQEQHYAMCLPGGEMVGDISVYYSQKDNCFTLGVTAMPAHWRQGYAFEMVSAVVAALRARYPQVDIVSLIDKENAASRTLFEKLGFTMRLYAQSIQSCVYVLAANTAETT